MEIKADVVLSFPRARVFAAYRDRLADLTEFLPNIRKIEVTSRTDRPGEVDLVNAWEGGGDIPAAVRSILGGSMLTWTDYATWREASFTVDWRTEVHAFPGAIACAGVNRFVEVSGGTRLEIRGDLTCDAAKIPAVPRLLSKSIGGVIEKFLVQRIAPNLVEVAGGVRQLLEREPLGST
jgi:hypothetical protein